MNLNKDYIDHMAKYMVEDVLDSSNEDLADTFDNHWQVSYYTQLLYASPFVIELQLTDLNGSVEFKEEEEVEASVRKLGIIGDYGIDWHRGTFYNRESGDLTLQYTVKALNATHEAMQEYKEFLMMEISAGAHSFYEGVCDLVESGRLVLKPKKKKKGVNTQ